MWRDFKNHFGELDSYKSLPMDQLQEGRDYIRNWRPSTNTVMDIERLNAQTELEV
ncbi:MAG: ORF6C domain-containing protein [Weissella cibaria]